MLEEVHASAKAEFAGKISSLRPGATHRIRYSVRISSTARHGQIVSNFAAADGSDISGSTTDREEVRVIEIGPITGATRFSDSFGGMSGLLRPWTDNKEALRSGGSASVPATLPFFVWANIAAVGLGAGGFAGKRFLI